MTNLGDALAALCAAHDATRIDIGRYGSGRFHATVWWDGFTRSGIPCEASDGDTAEEAIAAALAKMAADRALPAPEVPALSLDVAA